MENLFTRWIWMTLMVVVGTASVLSADAAMGLSAPEKTPKHRLAEKNRAEIAAKKPTRLAFPKPTIGPDSLLRQADRFLSWKSYARAIEVYSELLTAPQQPLTIPQKQQAQRGLANAYRLVGDGPKAEQAYRDYFAMNPPETADNQPVLNFAQTLADNGKFKESQAEYNRYLILREGQRNRRTADLPPPAANIGAKAGGSKTPIQYRLEYLSLNTKNEEFSPMYFKDGLVYVSGSKGGSSIETTGSGGGSGYLDLFYVPSRSDLKATEVINADGSISKATNSRSASTNSAKPRNRIGNDSYTQPTANDSRTLGNFESGIRVTEGLGYDTKQQNPAQRFSKTLNTRYHEGPATFYSDGSRIIFTRNNFNEGRAKKSAEGVNKLKLYTAEQQNGAWANIEELPFNSDEFSVGHPALNKANNLLYFASDMPGGLGGTDIYVSRYDNGKWSQPQNLGPMVNSKGNELFPFADEAGNLYFSSDGRGGLGGLDVFFATLTGSGVVAQSVEALGAPINSDKDDFGLITDGQRQSGYLSSNRRNGSDDIYRFMRESSLYACRDLTIRLYDSETDAPLDSVTVEVRAKGEGLSDQLLTTDRSGLLRLCLSGDNEFRFRASHDGYVASTIGFTTRGLTDDQPSRLEMGLTKPTMLIDTLDGPLIQEPTQNLTRSQVRGRVMSQRDKQPIQGVLVRLKNDCTGDVSTTTTGPDGTYVFDLTEGCGYTLIASKEKYGTSTSKIKKLPKKSPPKAVAADLRLLSVGDVVALDNIYYDLDKTSIRADAARELDKLVITMRRYPSLVIEIRSHTDSRGDATYNKNLSTARARSVAAYLVSKGIGRKRVVANGYGETLLLNNCTDGVICTEGEHQRNRRTEFKVLAIK
jgi:outer membrane protein OmpA-like peptidoglycan-associated protein